MFKKKGSIIPKRFIESLEKKGQHIIKFGCDVEIIGDIVYPMTDGVVFDIPITKYCNTKKNKRTMKGFKVHKVYVRPLKYGTVNTMIRIVGQDNITISKDVSYEGIPHEQDTYVNVY